MYPYSRNQVPIPLKSCSLYPEFETMYPELETMYPELETMYPELETMYPELETMYPELETMYPVPSKPCTFIRITHRLKIKVKSLAFHHKNYVYSFHFQYPRWDMVFWSKEMVKFKVVKFIRYTVLNWNEKENTKVNLLFCLSIEKSS